MQARVADAQAEYQRGLANLKAAASDLRSLSSRVHGSEKGAKGARALPTLCLLCVGVGLLGGRRSGPAGAG